jgi:hypothetical protein
LPAARRATVAATSFSAAAARPGRLAAAAAFRVNAGLRPVGRVLLLHVWPRASGAARQATDVAMRSCAEPALRGRRAAAVVCQGSVASRSPRCALHKRAQPRTLPAVRLATDVAMRSCAEPALRGRRAAAVVRPGSAVELANPSHAQSSGIIAGRLEMDAEGFSPAGRAALRRRAAAAASRGSAARLADQGSERFWHHPG